MSLQDQIVIFKTYFNNKEKEFYSMKISYNKLAEENQKNLNIIHKILNNVNVHRHIQENSNDRFLLQDFETMKETYVINSLKVEIHNLKEELKLKDNKIEELTKQKKISKFIGIQNEYKTVCDEYIKLDNVHNELKQKYDNIKEIYNELVFERDALKNSLSKYKTLNEDMKKKLKFYQNETTNAHFIKEDMTDKLIFTKYSQKYLKNKIKQIDEEKDVLKNKVDEFQSFMKEKSKLENMVETLNKKYNFALFEKEQLLKKMRWKDKVKPIREINENEVENNSNNTGNLFGTSLRSLKSLKSFGNIKINNNLDDKDSKLDNTSERLKMSFKQSNENLDKKE